MAVSGARVVLDTAAFLVVVAAGGLWLVAVLDLVRRPSWQFEVTGQDKALWLVTAALTVLPAYLYWYRVRPRLQAAAGPSVGPVARGTRRADALAPPDGGPDGGRGWFADPGGSGGLRYWDGRAWTDHVALPRRRSRVPG
jgi:hypothetical protein